MIPPSLTKKNVLIIGDSLSIGYTPYVASMISDVAQVVHIPADVSDGGAEESSYLLQCLEFFLKSPSGMDFNAYGGKIDLITFNSGMHNLVINGTGVPGQSGNATEYAQELEYITQRLVAYTNEHPETKLMYFLTTAYLCDATIYETIAGLNQVATSIMLQYGVPIADPFTWIVDTCGGTIPSAGCANFPSWGHSCWCPHCPAGYSNMTSAVIAPSILSILNA
jgi:hypothetical protein